MDNPYQTPNADLQSPLKNHALKYVGFWARTGAYFIDTILMMIIIFPILFLVMGDGGFESFLIDSESPSIMVSIISYVLPVFMILGFWVIKGTTPGKMVFKAKIVDAKTGAHPSVLQFIGRYIGYIISSIVLCLGFFWIGLDKRKQGWHDKMSGTIVVSPSNDPELQISFDS